MNKVVPWLKSNWMIVALMLVVLASLPTALYFSSKMNRDLVNGFQARVKADESAISQSKLQYNIASPIPGIPDVERSDTANQALIDFFAQQRERIRGEAQKVWTSALELNRAGHELLMEGIFPAPPAGTDDRVARVDFTRRYLALADELIKTLHGGPAPSPEELTAMLAEQAARRKEQVAAQVDAKDVPADQLERIMAELSALRRGEYRRRAQEVGVYASPAVFLDIPAQNADTLREPPSVRYLWQWQEAAWVLQDIVKAIASVNARPAAAGEGGAGGDERPGVYGSVVKRIIALKVLESPAPPSSGSEEEGSSRRSSSSGGLVTGNPAVSLTGRMSGRDNQLYDVRLVQAELIVDTRRLPQLLDAIASTNLMTVLDMDLERVEPAADLLDGYDYGPDHVVKARLLIETIWFREWIVPYMPPEEKAARGVEEPRGEAPPG